MSVEVVVVAAMPSARGLQQLPKLKNNYPEKVQQQLNSANWLSLLLIQQKYLISLHHQQLSSFSIKWGWRAPKLGCAFAFRSE
jgi:hypothetical protein